jgi:protocatechuate 4,5-dioxygenase alpha chain
MMEATMRPPLEISGGSASTGPSWLGHHLHRFCWSLLEAENRAAFKADERGYLQRWPMTDAQRSAVLARDWNRLRSLGGRTYFLAKLAAADSLRS